METCGPFHFDLLSFQIPKLFVIEWFQCKLQ